VPCFSEGAGKPPHDPATHKYRVIEQHSIPIFTEDWGADEELLLLEGAETYGLGSWADIADHIGGYRSKDEVRDHYIKTYVESSKFPLPERAAVGDRSLSDATPRHEFQARKKRRIEECKEAAKNAAPATPKTKPTASVPACHEVQGYMPGRLEFETEYFNEAEEAVQHMQFEPGEGYDPDTPMDPEMDLKMTIMEIYNGRLKARVERKKIIFEHKLLEYRKIQLSDKKRTKEEKELLMRAKPFARMMSHADFEEFSKGIEHEYNLRQAIAQLQDWRSMQIGTLREGEKYEHEKQNRVNKPVAPLGMFDRLASSRMNKPSPAVETASKVNELVSPDLPMLPMRLRSAMGANTPPGSVSPEHRVLTNGHGHTNGVLTPQSNSRSNAEKPKFIVQPLAGYQPLKFKDNEDVADLHLLTPEEKELCSVLRLKPKAYLVIKEFVLREAMKQGGAMKKKAVRDMCKIDVNKGSRLFDFFVHSGWIVKA